MRYANVCGQYQESNVAFGENCNGNTGSTKTNSFNNQPTSIPNQDRCAPFDVSALNGRNQTVAMAYVPGQKWKETYEDEQGFMRGTMFPELDKPFHPIMGGTRK